MGWFASKNYGIAAKDPTSYTQRTAKPPLYKGVKDWIWAGDYKSHLAFDPYAGFGGDINWKDNKYASEGWFPVWYQSGEEQPDAPDYYAATGSPGAAPLTPEQQVLKNAQDLSNPNSKYYTDFTKTLKGILSSQSSLNSLLGLNKAMGLGMESSATIANEQRNALTGKITDYAGQATKDLFLSNTQNASNLLGTYLGNQQFNLNLGQNQSQYNQARSDSRWNNNMYLWGNFGNQLKDLFRDNRNNNTKISYWDNWDKDKR